MRAGKGQSTSVRRISNPYPLSVSVILALVLLPLHELHTAPADLDPSFDIGSRINAGVSALAIQPDSKVLIGGEFITVHGAMRNRVARLNTDGTVDLGFAAQVGGTGVVSVAALELLLDGRILIAGHFGSVEGERRNGVARLNADGTLDRSFADGLAGVTGLTVEFVAGQSDGKVLVAGSLIHDSGTNYIRRLTRDGLLDPGFLVTLTRFEYSPYVRSLILQRDGKILLAGRFDSVNGLPLADFVRLNPEGSLDSTFTNALAGPDEEVINVAELPDGKLLVSGYFRLADQTEGNVFRLAPDGTIDESFTAPNLGATVYAMAVQKDGKILLGGNMQKCCVRLNADGSPDPSFLNGLPGPNSNVAGLAEQSDGRILICGSFETVNGVQQARLARLNHDGSLDPAFPEGPPGPDYCLWSVAAQEDGKIVIAGAFHLINGVYRNHIARLNADASLDSSFRSPDVNTVNNTGVTLQPDGKILVSSWSGLGRLHSDGTRDTRFLAGGAQPLQGVVEAVALQRDGRVLAAGRIPSVGTSSTTNLVRLHANGSLDTSFSCAVGGADAWLEALALQPDGKVIVAGNFLTVNGVSQPYLARLNSNGSLDPGFLNGLAGPNGVVSCLALQKDGRIVFSGDFSEVNGTPCQSIGRLNADGSLDASFNAAITNTIYCLMLQPDGKVLVGGWFTSSGCTNLARLLPDGSPDDSFRAETSFGAVLSMAFQPDGKLLLAGQFLALNQTPCGFLARVMGEFKPPSILAQPQPMTTEEGDSFRFSIQTGGWIPVTHQWFFNQTNLLSGCTNSFLQYPVAQGSQSGAYSVVASNAAGAVTSAPAMLSIIPPVPKRLVPGLLLRAEPGKLVQIEYASEVEAQPNWGLLAQATMQDDTDWYFDLSAAAEGARYYRVSQEANSAPSVALHFVTAVTLNGAVADRIRLDYINRVGPVDAWVPLATVTLTNPPQLYFDTSAVGASARLYRVMNLF